METFISIFILFLFFAVVFIGGAKTFRRNWVIALLMIIFLSGFWFLWAFFELFTD